MGYAIRSRHRSRGWVGSVLALVAPEWDKKRVSVHGTDQQRRRKFHAKTQSSNSPSFPIFLCAFASLREIFAESLRAPITRFGPSVLRLRIERHPVRRRR